MASFRRLARLAKLTAIIADAWTILYIILVLGWQTREFVRGGEWPALPIKLVVDKMAHEPAVMETAEIARGIGLRHTLADMMDALLQVPVVVPLLLAVCLLTGFYVWLSHTERQFSKS